MAESSQSDSTSQPPPKSTAQGQDVPDFRKRSIGRYVKRLSSVWRDKISNIQKEKDHAKRLSSASLPTNSTFLSPIPATASSSSRSATSSRAPVHTPPEPSVSPFKFAIAPSVPAAVVKKRQSPVTTPEVDSFDSKNIPDVSLAKSSPEPSTTEVDTTVATGPTMVDLESQGPGVYSRSLIQQARAQALFAKYGLTLEPEEWITSAQAAPNATTMVNRVEKQIRMRVHRTCHVCQTEFGTEKICGNCNHTRCKECPRVPPIKKRPQSAKAPADGAITPAKGKAPEIQPPAQKPRPVVEKSKDNKHPIVRQEDGKLRTYSQPKQRIRRNCHVCKTTFCPSSGLVCTNCNHKRCVDCTREPMKKKKHADGHASDMKAAAAAIAAEDSEAEIPTIQRPERIWRKPKQRVRWECCGCTDYFYEGNAKCSSCQHDRCDNCQRQPGKKTKKQIDPEILKQVEEKLAQYTISPVATSDTKGPAEEPLPEPATVDEVKIES